jgi:enoyl-[acyl-carrier protein] reductase II
MEVEKYWMGALRRAVKDGDVEGGSLMAGQSVGLVEDVQPVASILAELQTEIEAEMQRVRQRLA